WEGWAILLRQKQKKLIMLPSETMIWQPEFTDKTLSRKIGAVQYQAFTSSFWIRYFTKWSLLGKRECVTRSFSVAFHHTLANSQLWAVLDDSRSG
ncbi:hypothetical protein U9Z74_27885, partial [Escherichia coli]